MGVSSRGNSRPFCEGLMKTIHDQRCCAYVLFAVSMTVHVLTAEAPSPICLSEFMADHQTGWKDEDGEPSGWIEIYNAGRSALTLTGWSLTDSPANLTKWRLPKMSLRADRHLVIHASGKNRALDLTHLHTNFRLSPQGGYLALVDRATNIVSEFAPYPNQPPGTSYGRAAGDLSTVGRFLHPTPGKPNVTDGLECAPVVTFSRPGGSITAPVTIQLQCSSSNATIHYTTDGTLPNARSPLYTNSLEISKTLHLRARAYEKGLLPSPLHSESYLLLGSGVETFKSSLPVLVVHTLGQGLSNGSSDSLAHLSIFEPIEGRTSLTNPPSFTTRAGYHVRGSSTLSMPKASFVLQFVGEFNQAAPHSVLELPADADWVLYGPNQYEPAMIHNPFIHQLSRDMGHYSPRTRFVEVYVVKRANPLSPRQYQGIYVLEEKIKIARYRVDIDRLKAADVKPPEVTGGYLLKIDRLGPGESGFWVDEASVVYVDPKESVITLPERAPQKRFLATYFAEFGRALQGPNWKDPVRGYRAYIDVDSWIDYHVLEVLSGNVDAFAFSTYFYKPRNGKIVFGPHWDFDRALGSTDGRDDDPRRWSTGPFFDGAWWARLFRDPDFWQLWVDRWQELRQKQFSREHLNGLIDRLSDELREAQPREAARWSVYLRGDSYQGEIDHMKEWLSNRVDFIDQQLVPKPRLTVPLEPIQPGSEVTLTIPNHATVYYSLDGSDPRLSQGSIRTNALTYSGPIRLNTDAILVARARNTAKRQVGGPRTSTPWSGPVSATFKMAPK